MSESHLPRGNVLKEGEDGGVQAPLEGAQGLSSIQTQIHAVPVCILLQGEREGWRGGEGQSGNRWEKWGGRRGSVWGGVLEQGTELEQLVFTS